LHQLQCYNSSKQIDRVDCRLIGYAFIELSWAIDALVKLKDLCIFGSERIQVNPAINLRELTQLHSKVESPSSTKHATRDLRATASGASTGNPETRGYYLPY
jgi:hypothetical protein